MYYSSNGIKYKCVCVCVFFPSILDIKFVGRTSRGQTGGRSHRIFNPPSFCGACLDFCREKDSAIPVGMLKVQVQRSTENVALESTESCFKNNLNASRPSEHPTQGEKCQNGWTDKTSSWHSNGFPDGSNIGSTV